MINTIDLNNQSLSPAVAGKNKGYLIIIIIKLLLSLLTLQPTDQTNSNSALSSAHYHHSIHIITAHAFSVLNFSYPFLTFCNQFSIRSIHIADIYFFFWWRTLQIYDNVKFVNVNNTTSTVRKKNSNSNQTKTSVTRYYSMKTHHKLRVHLFLLPIHRNMII